MKTNQTLALASLLFTSVKTDAGEAEKIFLTTGYTCSCTVKAGRTNEILSCTIFAEQLEGRVGIHNLLFEAEVMGRLSAEELDFFLFSLEKGAATSVPTFSVWSDDKSKVALLFREPVHLSPDTRYLQFSLQVASRTNSEGICRMRLASGEFRNWPALPEHLRAKRLPVARSEKGEVAVVIADTITREARIEFYEPSWLWHRFEVTPGEWYEIQFSWDLERWTLFDTFKATTPLHDVLVEIPPDAKQGFIGIRLAPSQER